MFNIKLKPIAELKTFSPDELNVSAETFLSSSNGIIGLEWAMKNGDERLKFFADFATTSHLSTISTTDYSQLWINTNNSVDCYNIVNKRPSLFPFQLNFHKSFWEQLKEQMNRIVEPYEMIFQIILKKRMRQSWQPQFRQMYGDYLEGIEVLTTNKLLRSIQIKMLEFIRERDEYIGRQPEIVGVDQKYSEEGYEAHIRLLIQGENKQEVAYCVRKALAQLSHANSWVLLKEKNTSKFIQAMQNRELPMTNLILCVSELLPFFTTKEKLSNNFKVSEAQVEVEVTLEQKNEDIFAIFPRGTKKQQQSTIDLSETLNNALRKLNLISSTDVVIQKVQNGAQLKKITFSLPAGLTLKSLESSTRNIQTELGFNNISFEQGDQGGTAAMVIPQEQRKTIYLGDLIQLPEFQEFAKNAELPILLGVDTIGKPIYTCLTKSKHILTAGTTGSGKSVYIAVLLLTLFIYKSPRDVQVILIDPKQVELTSFKPFPHVTKVVTDATEAYKVFAVAVEKMNERYKKFAEKGYKNIQQYNKNEKEKMPYLIVLVDEYADLVIQVNVEDFIQRLGQMARAAGIFMIISTQRPSVDVISGVIKANLPSRICFACSSSHDYKTVLDQGKVPALLGQGDGVYKLHGMMDIDRFQSALISYDEDEVDNIIQHFSKHWYGKSNFNKESLNTDSVKAPESDLQRLKRLVYETKETRNRQLQEVLGLRAERIKDLLEELCREGWLKKLGARKGYEILISEEQMKQQMAQK